MHFILAAAEYISKLGNLGSDYEKRSGKDLEKSPQPYGISCFFGAKDITDRKGQIAFVNKWLAVLHDDLTIKIVSEPKKIIEKYLTALQILMTIGFYIKSKTNTNYLLPSASILGQLIDEAAGVSATNIVDEQTRASCLLATERYLKEDGLSETSNTKIQSSFSEQEWDDLVKFVTGQCALLDRTQVKNYPMTSLMRPLFGRPLELLGWSAGYALGDIVSKSPPVRYTLTAALGGGVYLVVGSSASVCMIVVAPAVAGHILDTFCGLSLGFVLGKSLKLAGEGVGFGVGMSLDMSWQLLNYTLNFLSALYHNYNSDKKLSGISLIDGHIIKDGIDLMLVDLNNIATHLTDEHKEYLAQLGEFEIGEEELLITIDGKNIKIPLLTDPETHTPMIQLTELSECPSILEPQ